MSKAKSFPELFFIQAEKSRDKTALRYKEFGIWNRISWKEYAAKVNNVAASLIACGLKPGESVSILGDNCPDWMFCHIGTMAAGGVSCGIYSTSSPEEIEYVAGHCQAKFLFVEDEERVDKVMEVIERLKVQKIIIWDPAGLWGFSHEKVMFFNQFLEIGTAYIEENQDSIKNRTASILPESTAMLIYTSGTTGRPKGAMITHENILSVTETMDRIIKIREDDEILSYLPLAHIYENLISVFLPVWGGATVNFVESMETLSINLPEISPTIFAGVPRIWEKFVSSVKIKMSDSTILKRLLYKLSIDIGLSKKRVSGPKIIQFLYNTTYKFLYLIVLYHLKRQLGFERIRFAVCGAAPAGQELFEWFNAIRVPLKEGYGQTESTGLISLQRPGRGRSGFAGEPINAVEVRIAEDGEILIKGKNVFKGYFKAPNLTAETIKDQWLYTGDIGVIDNGFLKIIDRKKDIIITRGGKNITPSFIENKLKFDMYIQDAVVIGNNRKYLTALILIDEENITKYAQQQAVPFTTFEDLSRNRSINKLIQTRIEDINRTLSRVETIKKFRILPRRLYTEDGDVTPTQKVKRKAVENTYKDLIESMY